VLSSAKKPPLLLLHGFGGGVGIWVKNLAKLAELFTLYAIDVPGFGRSSCIPNGDKLSVSEIRELYIRCIEQWRQAMGLESFFLMGHSMGGYYATDYALKYPQHVIHLILAAPFGFKRRLPGQSHFGRRLPRYFRPILSIASRVGPMGLVRALGPLGRILVNFRSRYDNSRYNFPDNRVSDYVFHLVVNSYGADRAFITLNDGIGFAKEPLIDHVTSLAMPLSMIYGENDQIMTPDTGYDIRTKVPSSEMYLVPDAAHHVYATHPDQFHQCMIKIARTLPTSTSSKNIDNMSLKHS